MEIKKWLISDLGYKPLILSTDLNCYYEAICANKLDISEMVENFGECLIVFNCKPLKREMLGDNKIILTKNSISLEFAFYDELDKTFYISFMKETDKKRNEHELNPRKDKLHSYI